MTNNSVGPTGAQLSNTRSLVQRRVNLESIHDGSALGDRGMNRCHVQMLVRHGHDTAHSAQHRLSAVPSE